MDITERHTKAQELESRISQVGGGELELIPIQFIPRGFAVPVGNAGCCVAITVFWFVDLT
jgi:hypothetical protein